MESAAREYEHRVKRLVLMQILKELIYYIFITKSIYCCNNIIFLKHYLSRCLEGDIHYSPQDNG